MWPTLAYIAFALIMALCILFIARAFDLGGALVKSIAPDGVFCKVIRLEGSCGRLRDLQSSVAAGLRRSPRALANPKSVSSHALRLRALPFCNP
jgi:hypothetical protein